eukprot:TRINITY_DN79725_c0_g1_i1.p1 TRINITY_DN79725_c0_g1~~TRINITY_DN79725_c0_g1_i1.p1  ORF type:complete len:938 (+),score=120.38 TRINITY_DN79725_c0_g1_i1:158-2971(+)
MRELQSPELLKEALLAKYSLAAASQFLQSTLSLIDATASACTEAAALPVRAFLPDPAHGAWPGGVEDGEAIPEARPDDQQADMITDISAFKGDKDDDKYFREQLQMIKARTMYQMVENIDENCRLVFLTNPQADLLASSTSILKKMLDVLDVPKPKLVINLLKCPCYGDFHRAHDCRVADSHPGLVYGAPAFLSHDEERKALERIDRFMKDVLLPLAASTNAIILCEAVGACCVLASSLMRMFALQRSKWGESPPFTIIQGTKDIADLYASPSSQHWQHMRSKSRAWQQRDSEIASMAHEVHCGKLEGLSYDLDPNGMIFILTDGVNPKTKSLDTGPFNRLMLGLLSVLGSSLPSLAVKTAHGTYKSMDKLESAAGGNLVALKIAQTGTPLLFLDVRERMALHLESRAELIKAAQENLSHQMDEYLEGARKGTCSMDHFDIDMMAHFREILFGDGNPATADNTQFGHTAIPLHRALSIAKLPEGTSTEGKHYGLLDATEEQVADLVNWYADRYSQDAWALREDREQREARGETYQSFYSQNSYAQRTIMQALLTSPSLHGINLAHVNTASAQLLVNRLVRLDRLPKRNSVEALELLQGAWCEYDVAMMLAGRYKRLFKTCFLSYLILTWLVVASATALPSVDANQRQAFADAVFAFTIAISLLVSIDGVLNSKVRWRKLRTSAGALESMIWLFRTRVGPFEMNQMDGNAARPEHKLCEALNDWREDVVTSAALGTSDFNRSHVPAVYKHFQYKGELQSNDEDDHQSPVQPHRYITLRINKAMVFYQHRIPVYTRLRFALTIVILGLGIVASILAYAKLNDWVVMITSAAGLVTTWNEFSDAARKTERYTRAVSSLKKLLSWWSSLGEVEKANRDTIAHLICASEEIISEERIQWMSTANNAEMKGGDDEKAGLAQNGSSAKNVDLQGKNSRVLPELA